MKRLCSYLIVFPLLFYFPAKALAQSEKAFKTKYTTVYYSQDNDLDDFVWRLGGQRLELSQDKQLVSNRIDRLVSRVCVLLDMWPNGLSIPIYLQRGALESNKVAYYNEHTKAIHISVEYASDGVLAHEISHAVINRYFASPPPTKMQEILSQYVDAHLWSDY